MKHQTALTQRLARWAGISFMALALAGTALAQTSSKGTITIVVGFAPGAGTDTLARSIAEQLQRRLDQTVIVENKTGAGGAIAVNAVAKAPADGHTLLFAPNTLVIAPHLLTAGSGAQTNVLTDLAPVIQATKSTLLLVTSPAALDVKDAKALTALARTKAGLTYGTAGNGTPQHIAGELYRRSAGIDITHVPYRGTGPALTDLMGGHLSFAISSMGAAIPYIQSGRLVPLAVVEKSRTPLLPDVPTMTEQGITGVELSGWFGLLAPNGTPQSQIDKLNRELNAVLANPEIQQKFRAQGEVTVGGTSQAFAQLIKDEYSRYGRIIKEFGIKSE